MYFLHVACVRVVGYLCARTGIFKCVFSRLELRAVLTVQISHWENTDVSLCRKACCRAVRLCVSEGQRTEGKGPLCSLHTFLRLALPPEKPEKAWLTTRAWACDRSPVFLLPHPIPSHSLVPILCSRIVSLSWENQSRGAVGRTELGEFRSSKYCAHFGVHVAYI